MLQSTLAPVNINHPWPKEISAHCSQGGCCSQVCLTAHGPSDMGRASSGWCCCIQAPAGLGERFPEQRQLPKPAAATKSRCCCYRGDSQRETVRARVCVCACAHAWGGGSRKENWEELQEQAFSGLFCVQGDRFVLLFPVLLQFPIAEMGCGNSSNSSTVQKVRILLTVTIICPFLNRTS